MQHRPADRTNLQFDSAGIVKFLGQRNFVPLEAWRPHIDREQTVRSFPGVKNAGFGLESEVGLAALLGNQIGDTPHSIPAGAGLRTIIVVDTNECVRARRTWGIKRHQLIIKGPLRARRSASFLGFDFAAASAHIDNDNFVADSVHLHKGLVGERAHSVLLPGFRQVYMANKRGLTSALRKGARVLTRSQAPPQPPETLVSPPQAPPDYYRRAFGANARPSSPQKPPRPPDPNRNRANAAGTPSCEASR